MKILLVEDDAETAGFIARFLEPQGHVVERLADGREALLRATEADFDVAIVDRMLPGMDGLSLVKALRASGNALPVLFLTTLGGIDDRVEGLEGGGDDYLVKPFAPAELAARLVALARRPRDAVATILRVGDLELDRIERRVMRAGRRIELQPQEFRLLECLLRHEGRAVTRKMLLEEVWDFHFDPGTNIVESHISRLRAKIDRDFDGELIRTVRGVGYMLRA